MEYVKKNTRFSLAACYSPLFFKASKYDFSLFIYSSDRTGKTIEV